MSEEKYKPLTKSEFKEIFSFLITAISISGWVLVDEHLKAGFRKSKAKRESAVFISDEGDYRLGIYVSNFNNVNADGEKYSILVSRRQRNVDNPNTAPIGKVRFVEGQVVSPENTTPNEEILSEPMAVEILRNLPIRKKS